MKVRRKVNPYREWIVKEESTSFYIAYVGDSDPTALPKADYEPVEEWVYVTGMYGGIQVTVPGLEERQYRLVNSTGGYRLEERKRA